MKVEELTSKIHDRLKRIYKTPEFEDASQHSLITGPIPGHELYLEKARQTRNQFNPSLPEYVRPCYEEPLLNREQEYHLFRRYNYHKFLAQNCLDDGNIKEACLELSRADEIRKIITNSNVRIGSPVTRRFRNSPHFEDLVGEAYFLIHRSVDYFDYCRGFKFSTYATWAVIRTVGRKAKELIEHDSRNIIQYEYLTPEFVLDKNKAQDTEQIHFKLLASKLLAFALPREQEVLRLRFLEDKTLTLQAIADKMNISKERVRQIESKGLERIAKKAEEMGLSPEKIW